MQVIFEVKHATGVTSGHIYRPLILANDKADPFYSQNLDPVFIIRKASKLRLTYKS